MNRSHGGFPLGKILGLFDMLEVKAKPFFKAYEALAYFSAAVPEIIRRNPELEGDIISEKMIQRAKDHLSAVLSCCDTLSLATTSALAKRMMDSLDTATAKYISFAEQSKELLSRFSDELNATTIYALPSETAKFYAKGEVVFGDEVVKTFSDTQDDFEEAAKCLALSRGTACVFHLMRIMESAIHDLGNKLGFTIKDKNDKFLPWGILVANMEGKTKTLTSQAEISKWTEVRLHLHALSMVWRNPTMHPKKYYTVEQAHEILVASTQFLRNLAPLMQ